MNTLSSVGVLMAAALVLAGNAHAHHSQSMFVETPVWVQGTIVRYRPVDPHVMIELEEKLSDGTVRRWIVEGPRMGRLERILKDNGGLAPREFLGVGDAISTCGFGLKKDFPPEASYPDWPPEEGRFVHGQVLVMPDGRMLSWGPYGKLDNCVRTSDGVSTWVGLLNRDRRAHEQWCAAQTYRKLKQLTPKSFLDAVGRGMDVPCR
jgi:hypothetical protein